MNRTILSFLAGSAASMLMAQATTYPNGSTVADFTVTDTHGQVHNLNSYAAQGKYVLLDFFFYNCGPCEIHAPFYSELYQTYGCNGGDLICIEIDDGADTDALTQAFSEVFAPGFAHPPAVGSGGGAALTSTFGVGAFPTFCLISPAHVMINQDIWPVSDMSTFVAAFPVGSNITPHACVVGIEEAAPAHFASVSPSLTSGPLSVIFNGTRSQAAEIVVFDMMGQAVFHQATNTAPGTEHTLDLGALASGNYLMKLIVDGMVTDAQRITIAR